jgi:iron complex outermembrane receptor protein
LTFSVSDTWTDYHYSALFNGPAYKSPGYNNLDARLIWTDAMNRYTVILWGKNILNATQYDYIFPGTTPAPNQAVSVSLNAPVTFGVEVQARFR